MPKFVWFTIVCALVFAVDTNGSMLLLLADGAKNSTTVCAEHLKKVQSGWEDGTLWAIKMVDASGQLPTGFVWGNNFMLGSKLACDFMHVNQGDIVLSERYHRLSDTEALTLDRPKDFDTTFSVVYARHTSKYQIDVGTVPLNMIHIGLCLPITCEGPELETFMQEGVLNSPDLTLARINLTVVASKIPQLSSKFWQDTLVRTCFGLFLVQKILVTIGTYFGKPEAFSIKKNSERLFKDYKGDIRLKCISGIKVLSMLMILNGHISFYSLPAMNNMPMILPYMTKFNMQPAFSSMIFVDTFFAVSGFLTAFLYRSHKDKPFLHALKCIIGRFLKFTPSYAIAILIKIVATMYFKDVSPYYQTDDQEFHCREYWWRNLLYINNFFPMQEMCMYWSWYLSVDFQLFILGIVLLTLYPRYKAGVTIGAFIIFMHSVLSMMMLAVTEKYALSLDVIFHTRDLFYSPVTGRVGAYLMALGMGYWYKNQKELKMPKGVMIFLFILFNLVQMFLVHSQMIRGVSFYGPFTVSFGRVLWSWSTCCLIISCSTVYGAQMAKFFGSSKFLVLSRLTFSVYLINPIVIEWFSMKMENPFYLAWVYTILMFIGYSVIIYLAAFIFKMNFEDPYSQLISTVMELGKRQQKSKEVSSDNNNDLEAVQKSASA